MKWNDHSSLQGTHSVFSPSKYHWVNYDTEKIATVYRKHLMTQRGVELHEFASHCIKIGQKLPKNNNSLNRFVNDAVSLGMRTEQPLFYSINFYGTCDAIRFKDNILRIYDLKTGLSDTSFSQLKIYAAIFCLEYGLDPINIYFELHIYQINEIKIEIASSVEISNIMDKIVIFDDIINNIKQEDLDHD
jgi:hypothetical protein